MADTDTALQPFPLLDLPPELVGKVCDHLDDGDLQCIRQVNRALETQSTTAFGQRFFDHLIVILHPISLTIFLEIARHSELCKFVRRVSVSGEHIGQSMTPVDDQETHEDLQRSIERSGLDSIILKEAFAALTNLETIRIDTEQYFCGSDAQNHHPGVQCGRAHMFKQESPRFDWHNPLASNGYSRVYALVLGLLKEHHVHARVDLELSFCAMLRNQRGVVPGYFDVQSSIWKAQASKKLQYLQCLGDVEQEWLVALLQSIPDLHRLELVFPEIKPEADTEKDRMFYGFVDSFYWPNLFQLRLEDLTTSHTAFVKFLMAHQDTVGCIWFSKIGFSRGTWSEPFAVISKMPKLRVLFLQMLLERESYMSASFPDEVPDVSESSVHVWGRHDVTLTMQALLGPMATRPNRYGFVEGNKGEFYYCEVDLRLGIAATFKLLPDSDEESESLSSSDSEIEPLSSSNTE